MCTPLELLLAVTPFCSSKNAAVFSLILLSLHLFVLHSQLLREAPIKWLQFERTDGVIP